MGLMGPFRTSPVTATAEMLTHPLILKVPWVHASTPCSPPGLGEHALEKRCLGQEQPTQAWLLCHRSTAPSLFWNTLFAIGGTESYLSPHTLPLSLETLNLVLFN